MLKVFWFLLLATVVWGAVMQVEMAGYVKQPSRFGTELPPDCANKKTPPIAQLELTPTAPCFAGLIGPMQSTPPDAATDGPMNLKLAVRNTHEDYAFITLYWLTFLAFAWVLWTTDRRTMWLGAAVAILITVAAGLDLRENQLMLAGFRHIKEGNLNFATSGVVSTVKWCVFGIATTVLGIHCFVAEKLSLRKVIGGLLVVSGLLTLVGTLAWKNPILILLFIAMPLALVSYFPWKHPKGKAVATFLIYAYLLRFPIINGLLLAVVLPAGYFYAPSIFYGLFDAMMPFSFFLICFAAFLLAIIIMITARIALAYAPERFSDVADEPVRLKASWRPTILFSLLAIPMIVMTWIGSRFDGISIWKEASAVLLAALCALAFLLVTAMVHARLEASGGDTVSLVYPPFPKLAARGRTPFRANVLAAKAVTGLPANLADGMVGAQQVNGKEQVVLRSGHRLASVAFLTTLVFYVVIGWTTMPSSRVSSPAAMFYILLLLSLWTWFFSGVAFFLDRLRVPVLTAILVLSMILAVAGGNDHVFELVGVGHQVKALDATDVIGAWAKRRNKAKAPIVVVATAGGGIRASAWTTEVLTGLAERCEIPKGKQGPEGEENPQGGENAFTSSVVLVSSVSGGSEGAMYFTGWYDEDGATDISKAEKIRVESSETDLGAVGWGLVYPDLLRTIPLLNLIPVYGRPRQAIDRGAALEGEWKRHWVSSPASATLREWNVDVKNGSRPANIFNATVSETGNRFVAATTSIYEKGSDWGAGSLEFFSQYPSEDIPVSTAARLSATFPFVSPMARPDTKDKLEELHFADGGYYDNSGLLSALQWLMNAGGTLKDHKVLLLIIDSTSPEEPHGGRWTWQRQIVAPIGTLLSVRTSSQELRGRVEMDIVENALERDPKINTTVTPIYLPYKGDPTTPLSWHLRQDKVQEITNQWKDLAKGEEVKKVLDALNCGQQPTAHASAAVRK